MTDPAAGLPSGAPERPTLDGIEATWARRWQTAGTYAVDPARDPAGILWLDIAPATPVDRPEPDMGHILFWAHLDVVARFQRMRGWSVRHHVSRPGTRPGGAAGLPPADGGQAFTALRRRLGVSVGPSTAPPAGPVGRYVTVRSGRYRQVPEMSTRRPSGPPDAVAMLSGYGADALRYWATGIRPGVGLWYRLTGTSPDSLAAGTRIPAGRRLAVDLLQTAWFAHLLGACPGAVTAPLDRALLARLAQVVDTVTTAYDGHRLPGGVEATTRFFRRFRTDYLALVKNRAYGQDPGSARATLAAALSVQLRLFAPVMPYVTEEIWSWRRADSVHLSAWPTSDELDQLSGQGDPELLRTAGSALRQVRRARSERGLSPVTPVPVVRARGPVAVLDRLEQVADDVRAAGRIDTLHLTVDAGPDLVLECAFRGVKIPSSAAGRLPRLQA